MDSKYRFWSNARKSITEKEFKFGSAKVIALGEAGRGRTMEYVHYFGDSDAPALVRVGTTRAGKPKLMEASNGSTEGWVAHITTNFGYKRGSYGQIRVPRSAAVKLLAKGQGAFGLAGRTGSYRDYLVIVPYKTWIRVEPSGHASPYWLYFDHFQVYSVPDHEVDLFVETQDVALPPQVRDMTEV